MSTDKKLWRNMKRQQMNGPWSEAPSPQSAQHHLGSGINGINVSNVREALRTESEQRSNVVQRSCRLEG
jgi:hypothetical protein